MSNYLPGDGDCNFVTGDWTLCLSTGTFCLGQDFDLSFYIFTTGFPCGLDFGASQRTGALGQIVE